MEVKRGNAELGELIVARLSLEEVAQVLQPLRKPLTEVTNADIPHLCSILFTVVGKAAFVKDVFSIEEFEKYPYMVIRCGIENDTKEMNVSLFDATNANTQNKIFEEANDVLIFVEEFAQDIVLEKVDEKPTKEETPEKIPEEVMLAVTFNISDELIECCKALYSFNECSDAKIYLIRKQRKNEWKLLLPIKADKLEKIASIIAEFAIHKKVSLHEKSNGAYSVELYCKEYGDEFSTVKEIAETL